MPSSFERLHPAVQRRLWDMRWTELHAIQDQAINHLITGGRDCIISAPTAGGKTEAAFLPILSIIADDFMGGVRAMYIGPLKALINDQFRRVEGLCERMEVPVHKWHGDVSDTQRRALLEAPGGVLLITPESLEAMFVLRPARMPALFRNLSHVVIDELHSFIGSVRGAQLLSQLHRLSERCGCDPVRVGLSATIGSPEEACTWLRRGHRATYIDDSEAERRLAIRLHGHWSLPETLRNAAEEEKTADDSSSPAYVSVARAIMRSCHTTTNLVFANSKGQIEELADDLKAQAAELGARHDVVVHHGSLSKEQRESAEERLRGQDPCTAVCSNTLEMGIDIGEIDNVVQVSAPWSVASLTQRLGRSGRKTGGTARLRAHFVEDVLGQQSTFWDGLHLDFLRGIASIELMLEKFSEPLETERAHLSTLVHQLLSTLAETSGLPAQKLYRRLVDSGAFGRISPSDFSSLLRSLGQADLISQVPSGEVVLGLKGERIREHYSFYAAFVTPDEFRVLFGTSEIGKLMATALPLVGEPVLLGGRRWTVVDLDPDRREVNVVPSRSRRKPQFRSGVVDIHPRVHAQMRALATGADTPRYLDEAAIEILREVRLTASRADGFHPEVLALDGDGVNRLFVWGGSRLHRTLYLALALADIPVTDESVGIDANAPLKDVREALRRLGDPDIASRLAGAAIKMLGARAGGDKFDWAVPDDLWARSYANERLAIDRAVAWSNRVFPHYAARRRTTGTMGPPPAGTHTTVDLSATGLSNYLACQHRGALDLAVARGLRTPPEWIDPAAVLLAERGLEHERRYVQTLREQGLDVADLSASNGTAAVEETREAMRTGLPVIVQGGLRTNHWVGRPDVLVRTDKESALGAWSYEAQDTKLARETRGGTVLQLGLYSELLDHEQKRRPEKFSVITPDGSTSFRLDEYSAYFRLIQAGFEDAAQQDPERLLREIYPEPVDHCGICRWWAQCDQRRRLDDHLSLVAGLSRLQQRELQSVGIATLSALGSQPLAGDFKPKRGARETYVRLHEQARVQLRGRKDGKPVHELLPMAAGRGLSQLPAPSPGDVFLDLEGDPFVRDGGREYLFGLVREASDGALVVSSRWGASDAEERIAFEATVDEIQSLLAEYPSMHVYHYSPYEPAAFRRLMGRHGTREEEIDGLLRAGRFVDLRAVVKQTLRASVEQYSLKDLEPFYAFKRTVDLPEARKHLRAVEQSLELRNLASIPDNVKRIVEGYNRDDCVSTLRLRNWLEGLRTSLEQGGTPVSRPEAKEGAPSEKLGERIKVVRDVASRLSSDVPKDRALATPDQRARLLLGHLLDWHRRENNAGWHEFYRLRGLSDDDLLDERSAIANLRYVTRVSVPAGRRRVPVDRYEYPDQNLEIRGGSDLHLPATPDDGGKSKFGTVESIDKKARTIDVKKTLVTADLHPTAAFAFSNVDSDVLADALLRLGQEVAEVGLDASLNVAARALLRAEAPRLRGGDFAQSSNETASNFAVRVATDLHQTVLPIQGPPGAGKTTTGAEMICALVAAGARVGVTAFSHKAIANILDRVQKQAQKGGMRLTCVHKVTDPPNPAAPVEEIRDNGEALQRLTSGSVQVIGATPFFWAALPARRTVATLFVDEAGQMSLANVLAASHAAENVVLLGDPQQLEQPLQGTHPEGSDVSALQHFLGDEKTIPSTKGIFLNRTWRLPPAICEFTKEVFYEGRLESAPHVAQQELLGTGPFAGAGLWVVPVEHDGNQNTSPEEAEVIRQILGKLLRPGARWVDDKGREKPLGEADVLVVAPYNSQVSLIEERLNRPNVKVGTVDRFQGQEAPVVIYSMATSSPEDAPRGMEFLYSLNRLNVATSRARCACILVASPRLFQPECKSPRQMRLANALCRYRELARIVDVPGLTGGE